MKLRILTLLVLMGLGFSLPAFALDLHGARDAGLVGEKSDGYIAALKATPDVEALVAEVNAKRKTEYARISKENGQPVDIVAKLAAGQVIGNLKPGQSYQTPGGTWKKR